MADVTCILGIRRSGNSPVRNWVADQFPDPKVLLNAHPDVLTKVDEIKESHAVISFEESPVELFDRMDGHKKVLILRDPANLFASRVKHYNALSSKKKFISPIVSGLWLNHARKFQEPGDVIPLNHQLFLTNEDYRREISSALGGKFSDKTLDFVDDNGQGSSFDGLDYDGNAREMPVFDRWKEYEDLDCFRELFTEEIQELSKAIFGEQEWVTLFT